MTYNIIKQAGRFLQKNSPVIFAAVAISGVVATAILAVKATPDAKAELDEFEENAEDEVTVIDKVKVCWRFYVPTAAMGAATISCIVASNVINSRRQAAISAAYILSRNAFDEYKHKVIETLGEKKHEKIQEAIAEEKVAKIETPQTQQIVISEPGNQLCFDCWSGRYFMSTMEELRRIENDVNRDLSERLWVSLNDVYDRFGLEPVKMGEDLGWSKGDRGLDFIYSACLSPSGEPTLTIDFMVDPKY